MDMTKVGIIGAGTMGCDIALDFSSNNIPVVLKDISDVALENAYKKIRATYFQLKLKGHKFIIDSLDDILANIKLTEDYNDFDNLNYVVENVSEIWEEKKKVFTELNSICSPSTIYAVNTSCISITKVASLMDSPENVIGVHFMNPVPLKKVAEVILGYYTSENSKKEITELLKQINKSPIYVNDMPGFVSNRISHLFMNEAMFVIQDNVAGVKEVDKIFKEGFGHKMGPLETADLIGLDVVLDSLLVLYDSYKDQKFKPCPLLIRMVDAGLHGVKSGAGFYNY